jgi:hypothetical protein
MRKAMAFFLLTALIGWSACASGGGGGEGQTASADEIPPPADSPLAKVETGMSDEKVREILGEPDDTTHYTTGKAWIPYYHGPDTSRADWIYKGIGRVVFSRNRYSHQLKVIEVLYNPGE